VYLFLTITNANIKEPIRGKRDFGLWNRQVEFYLLNHLLILAKQHIYSCRNKGFLPSLKIFLAKVFSVYQIKTVISDSKGK